MKTNETPLRLKPQTNGIPRLQGAFAMMDRHGVPIAITYDQARANGWAIDWVEAMADAARQSVEKFEAMVAEVRIHDPGMAAEAVRVFASGLTTSEGETFCDKAQTLYHEMRR
jgi:alanyl-tRNA synthetase